MMPVLVTTCLNPSTSTGFLDIFACIGELTFGSLQLAGIALFLILLYMMWQLNTPKEVALPIGTGYLFVFFFWFAMPAFLSAIGLAIIIVAFLFVIGFLFLLRRSSS